jgi:2-polyprenyl-6-methoxyphenol hydroxylase-like FAD-dependent oxidoreductase
VYIDLKQITPKEPQMDNSQILISGAGIAGPALAFWLRANGFETAVVERAPAPRPGGQAVDLRGAGRTVVERMGLMDRAREIMLHQHGIRWVNDAGKVTAQMTVDQFGGEGIISEIEILRGDLGELFYSATKAETEYVFDDSITGLEQDDDGVTVTFEKSAPRRFGLVVGAEGLHSVVRGLTFGPESECVRPLNCYTAWFTAPAAPDLEDWYEMHNIPGGRVASVRPGRLPSESKAGMSFRSEPISYNRRDIDQQRDILTSRFAGAGRRVPWMLDAARQASDLAFDSLGQVHLEHWSKGRVALVGDAGYCPTPLTGLGTSLALVGAYVLAGELAAARGDHRVAFPRYEEVIRPYVSKAQELPPGGVKSYAPDTAWKIRLQAASMRSMNRWPMRQIMARQFAKAGDITLPTYTLQPG